MLAAELLDILFDVIDARELQPSFDAPRDRARLIVSEIDAEFALQHAVDGAHPLLGFAGLFGPNARPTRVLEQHAGHVLRRQDIVCHAGFAGRFRHAIELRALYVLNHHQPARLMDSAYAAGTITTTAGEDHCDCAPRAILGKR